MESNLTPWFTINESSEIITVDGVSCSRQIFKFFASDANVGKKFVFVSIGEQGIVSLEAIPESNWISVKDRLPEDYKWCLVYGVPAQADRNITTGYFCNKWGWHTDCDDQQTGERSFKAITHWMPLPELPNA